MKDLEKQLQNRIVTSVYKQFTHVWVELYVLRQTEGYVQMFKHLHLHVWQNSRASLH